MADLKQTSSYSTLSPEDVAAEVTSPPMLRSEQTALVSSRFVEALGVPAMILDEAGMVLCANDASAAVLQVDRRELVDEPLLTWIGGAQGRAGFGRQFLALTRGGEHEAFTRELDVRPRLGPPVRCQCRVARVSGFGVLLTLEAPDRVRAWARVGARLNAHGKAIVVSMRDHFRNTTTPPLGDRSQPLNA